MFLIFVINRSFVLLLLEFAQTLIFQSSVSQVSIFVLEDST